MLVTAERSFLLEACCWWSSECSFADGQSYFIAHRQSIRPTLDGETASGRCLPLWARRWLLCMRACAERVHVLVRMDARACGMCVRMCMHSRACACIFCSTLASHPACALQLPHAPE